MVEENPLYWERSDGIFRIGKDMIAVADNVLPPGQTKLVEATMPEGSFWSPTSNESYLRIGKSIPGLGGLESSGLLSVRSRLALCGVHMEFNSITSAKSYFEEFESPIAYLSSSVLGGRPVRVAANEGLACLFWTNGAQLMLGNTLYKTIEDSEVTIDGKLGSEWFYTVLRDSDVLTTDSKLAQESAAGIALRLENKRWFIPERSEPIDVRGLSNYRDYLFHHIYEEVPTNTHVPFYVVGTRAALHLPKGINGILNMALKVGDSWAMQTRSTLIKGGQTNWPVLCEVYIPLTSERMGMVLPSFDDYRDQYAIFHLYRDQNRI